MRNEATKQRYLSTSQINPVLFGHIARTPNETSTKNILTVPPPLPGQLEETSGQWEVHDRAKAVEDYSAEPEI